MKAMKGLSVNKVLGTIKRKAGGSAPFSPNRKSRSPRAALDLGD